MQNNNNDLVLIGKIGAPHGIQGWVKVYSFTEEPEDIFNFPAWNVSYGNNKKVAAEVVEYRAHQAAFVVKLATIDDRYEVAKLTNGEIYIAREELPTLDDDQHYWRDLFGSAVVNELGVEIGTLCDVMNTGANDIMIIKDVAGKKTLIPYVPEVYIKEIDVVARKIIVDWSLED